MGRNELGWDVPVAVAFLLNAAEPEPRSREGWEQPMDWTPPSLHLFETGKEFWAEISFQAPNVAEYQAIKLDLPHAARRWGRRILYNSYEQIPASGFARSS